MSAYQLDGKGVLVTGGTGSFGRAFVRRLLTMPKVRRVVVYSRDELKQHEMSLLPEFTDPRIRFFLGDVRDHLRLKRALEQIDVVVHAAALKQVPAAEYNPFEFIKTNVIGAQNVIEASLDSDVERVVALSTDKAAAPINLYGATKLCSDKLVVAANNYRGSRSVRFSVVRYGNVLGSRGSVVPFFLKMRHEGPLPVTDARMTRFTITLEESVDFVLSCLSTMRGGETFVPRIPSLRVVDLAEAVAPGVEPRFVGIRAGEKLHEELLTGTDSMNTIECKDRFVLLPRVTEAEREETGAAFGGVWCPPGFSYESGANPHFLTVEEIRAMIRRELDPEFVPLG
jgi:UDP-N-acetylglucosamine 4,6-dehydratase (inverting)